MQNVASLAFVSGMRAANKKIIKYQNVSNQCTGL